MEFENEQSREEALEQLGLVEVQSQRAVYSRVGLTLFCVMVISVVFQLWLVGLYGAAARPIFSYGTLIALMLLGHYVVSIPVAHSLTANLPKARLGSEKMTLAGFMQRFLIGILMMYAGSQLGYAVEKLIYEFILHRPMENALDETLEALPTALLVVCVCFIGPIMEELVFRKYLLRPLLAVAPTKAIFINGLLFGVFHGNFGQFFYAFLLGMLLSTVVVRTGKLRYSILLHMAFNVVGTMSTVLPDSEAVLNAWALVVMGMLLSGLLVTFVEFKQRREEGARGVPHQALVKAYPEKRYIQQLIAEGSIERRPIAWWSNVGMVLSIGYCVLSFIGYYAAG